MPGTRRACMAVLSKRPLEEEGGGREAAGWDFARGAGPGCSEDGQGLVPGACGFEVGRGFDRDEISSRCWALNTTQTTVKLLAKIVLRKL